MEYIVDGESLKKVEVIGDVIDVLHNLDKAKLKHSQALAKIARAEQDVLAASEEIAILEAQIEELEMPKREFSDEEKVKLVKSGLKSVEDFPGDDWLPEALNK